MGSEMCIRDRSPPMCVHVSDMVCVCQTVLWFAMNRALPVRFVLFSVYFDVVRLPIMRCGVNRWLFILLLRLLHCSNFSHASPTLAIAYPTMRSLHLPTMCPQPPKPLEHISRCAFCTIHVLREFGWLSLSSTSGCTNTLTSRQT